MVAARAATHNWRTQLFVCRWRLKASETTYKQRAAELNQQLQTELARKQQIPEQRARERSLPPVSDSVLQREVVELEEELAAVRRELQTALECASDTSSFVEQVPSSTNCLLTSAVHAFVLSNLRYLVAHVVLEQ